MTMLDDVLFYLQVHRNSGLHWAFDKSSAWRIDGPQLRFEAEPGEGVLDALRRQAPVWFHPDGGNTWHRLSLPPGHYYPRMSRPNSHHPFDRPGGNPVMAMDRDFVGGALGQLDALTEELRTICRTIHPAKPNMGAFGHGIRNVLVLASTEVEMHWKGVLRLNGITKRQLGTADYVKLSPALRLPEYSVVFPYYPWIGEFRPFEGWGQTGKPTQELGWYNAYNATKHDREREFHRATLERAFEAIAACFAMLAAQFGNPRILMREAGLPQFMELVDTPAWAPEDCYAPRFDNGTLTPVPYPWPSPNTLER